MWFLILFIQNINVSILIETKKDKVSNSPRVLISFNNTSNTKTFSSTIQPGQTNTNCWAAVCESWMARCSPRTQNFIRRNLHNKTSCTTPISNTNFIATRELQMIPFRESTTDFHIGSPRFNHHAINSYSGNDLTVFYIQPQVLEWPWMHFTSLPLGQYSFLNPYNHFLE